MFILGLTGSIGMGKSTAAGMLRRLGVPVHDADRVVHGLLARGGAAVAAVERHFGPGVVRDGAVDRPRLGTRVFGDAAALSALEAILHPLVRRAERRFLALSAGGRRPVVALDIPLLFETGGDRRVDATLVVTAPPFVQRARVLARPGMSPARLAAILGRQTPDGEKRRRAGFIIPTGLGKGPALRRLAGIVKIVRSRTGRHWPPRRSPPFAGCRHA
ncbi:MAG: dephospho-CoA kinase [Rhodospirillaceae bacterium]